MADLQKPGTSSYLPASFVAAPGVVGVGDLLDVVVGQFAVDAVDQRAQLAGVDEERLAAAVAKLADSSLFLFGARNQRQTGICVV